MFFFEFSSFVRRPFTFLSPGRTKTELLSFDTAPALQIFFALVRRPFTYFVSRKDNWSFSVSILLPLNDVGIRVRGSYFRTARVGRQLFPSALGGRTPAMPCTRHRPLERWSTSMPMLTPAWRTCTPRHRFKNWLFPSDQDQDLWKNLSLTIYMGTRFHIWPPAIVIHLVFECTLTCQKMQIYSTSQILEELHMFWGSVYLQNINLFIKPNLGRNYIYFEG